MHRDVTDVGTLMKKTLQYSALSLVLLTLVKNVCRTEKFMNYYVTEVMLICTSTYDENWATIPVEWLHTATCHKRLELIFVLRQHDKESLDTDILKEDRR